MDLSPVTLRGRHVVLEALRLDHAEELWPAASERDVWRYLAFDVGTLPDLQAWIARRLQPHAPGANGLGNLPFLQRDAVTGQAFGSTSLFDIDVANRKAEIGHTWIGASHRRTAANTEAKLLLLGHAFDTLEAVRVQFKCDDRNERSKAAIRRLGAKPEGVQRHWMLLADGHRRDTSFFSILESEWPSVRQHLQRRLQEGAAAGEGVGTTSPAVPATPADPTARSAKA